MDRYRRVKIIGKGAFGAAVLVQARNDPRQQYVIKQVDVTRLKPKEREEAKKEIKLLASFAHPNIVKYRDSFLEQGMLNIVMDYAEGGDLHGLIKEQNSKLLPEERVLDYFVQLCLAMKHVHDRKVLHRDIKSQNIFLTQNRRVLKLGDFGIARVLNNTAELARTACGTPYYMSPEICDNKPYNDKSDVWSMGCLLYELASLKCPFDARDMRGLVIKILRGAYPPLPRTFSLDLTGLVAKCLCRQPSQRPSVNDLLAMPLIRARIERFLSEAQQAHEFSHTVLHKNPANNHQHPAMPAVLADNGGAAEIDARRRDDEARLRREEAERAAFEMRKQEEETRRLREEAERARRARDEEARKAREDEARRLRAEAARMQAERDALRRQREEADRAERRAREEAERAAAREESARLAKRREEEARRRGEEAERRMREERRQRQEAERRRGRREGGQRMEEQRQRRAAQGNDLSPFDGFDVHAVSPDYERLQRQRRLLQERRDELARLREEEEARVRAERSEDQERRQRGREVGEALRRGGAEDAIGVTKPSIAMWPPPNAAPSAPPQQPRRPAPPRGYGEVQPVERAPSSAAEVLAARDARKRAELEAQEAAAREAGRRVWEENQAAARRNREQLEGEGAGRVERQRSPMGPAVVAAQRAVEEVVPPERPVANKPQVHQISAAERRQQYHDAKAAAERNRLRVLGDMGEPVQLVRERDEAAAGPGLAPKVPPALAKKLDRRNSGRDARKRVSEEVAEEPQAARPSDALQQTDEGRFVWPDAAEQYTDEFEIDSSTAEEYASEGSRKEELAYSELLETMRELAVNPSAAAADGAVGMDGDEHQQDEDLVAAGVMSGIDEAPEDELQALMEEESPSAPSIRRLLVAQLGHETFAAAHARLQNVVEEEDDDVLVNDLQDILGPGKLKLLPMILKLIFLEEQKIG
ncbi:hypothetical protein AB1Y20_017778 [Prymnesium parvum]|uniref:non-specific serine/threonine protein kinase n=1 Tax=Prymnesium parvum TaxID=97485 RepID=A0AB34JP42_PRYPA